MQLKGISRKTIMKSLKVTEGMNCDVDTIRQLLIEGAKVTKRIKVLSDEEILTAIEVADKIVEESKENGIGIVTYLDPEYPKRMLITDDPPAILYYKGDISYLNTTPTVAVIGTREPSKLGESVGMRIGKVFAENGFVVVSGLAIGCDTCGHVGCLSGEGKTVAFLAGGLESIYPAANKKLAQDILDKGGALISEYPIHTEPFPQRFVERDRLQSALSDGVMVIETGETGGTWHASRRAVEYGRLLACYNHPEKYRDYPKSAGNQKMINENMARPITDNEDLYQFMEDMRNANKKDEMANNSENNINSEAANESHQLTLNELFKMESDRNSPIKQCIRMMVPILNAKGYNAVDLSNTFVRRQDIRSAHECAANGWPRPTVQEQLATIQYNVPQLTGKVFYIVLDDVTTQGRIMKEVCCQQLVNSGIDKKNIQGLVLGKTLGPNMNVTESIG